MRPVLMIISVLFVLTGCMSGVSSAPGSAAEMRAAVGRSAHVLRETHIVGRVQSRVTATVAARARTCLDAPWMAEDDARVALVSAVADAEHPLMVVDFKSDRFGRTEIAITRGADAAEDEARAVLAWARGNTTPCPAG